MPLLTRRILPALAFFCVYLFQVNAETRLSIDTPLDQFSSHGRLTAEVFKELAYHAHLPIWISGFVIDKANAEPRTISLDANGKSTQEILDELCRQDPDYKWQQFSDQSIHVQLGGRPLSVINVVVRSLTIDGGAIMANGALSLFLRPPEIVEWEQTNKCRLGHPVHFIGHPRPDVISLPRLEIHDKPLWKVFNELSTETQRYFWLAIGSASGSSCYVDVDILSAR